MKKQFYFVFIISLFFILMVPFYVTAQGTTLVDFGSSPATTTFGLEGWNTLLQSGNLDYTSQGNGGLICTSDPGEYGDFRGVSGTPRNFIPGERIVVTWYNNSNEEFFFTARISFTDDDEPNEETPDGNWYTMRSFDDYRYTYSRILPGSSAKTVFNITDSGVHKTDDTFSLVNINTAMEGGSTYQKLFLICEKIELLYDADITPPAQPDGLTADVLSDSKIRLDWNEPSDNTGVVEYLVYMNGNIEGYSRTNNYTCVFLEPGKDYVFSVSALDACGNESIKSNAVTATTRAFGGGTSIIDPAGFEYLGAFVLPEDFNWGGEAIAYYRDGDGGQSGSADDFPGSLFVTNLNQQENGLVGQVGIPAPVISAQKNVSELNQAATIIQPVNIRPENINNWEYVDIWRTGLEYIPDEGRLYSSWSIHYTVSGEKHASISCCNAADLPGSTKYGAWYVGKANEPPIDAAMNDWLFSLPGAWADENCLGRNIVVGRCRDGGLSGLGPTMYAFAGVGNTPPAANSELEFTTLLEYGSVEETDNYNFPNSIDGYNHSDDWRGAMWLNSNDRNAVAVVGSKALGFNWYGYHGERMHYDWVIADVPWAEFGETDPDGKGWRSHNRQPMILLYDPADLAAVAGNTMDSWEPQPYAALRIDKNLFFCANYEIFSAAFDSINRILYIAEFVRDPDGQVILHAWRVEAVVNSIPEDRMSPGGFLLDQNYPNPFNGRTAITFRVPRSEKAILKIYNINGQEVRGLMNDRIAAGQHKIIWDGLDNSGNSVSSGVYIYKLSTKDYFSSRKLILLR
ncbi:T9SS type A sorting domain-containing protein [candidate division KSB1 bacterium]|nr:T9SS type A sorting domain-containing protein [candidate division KSB1 bacterium]